MSACIIFSGCKDKDGYGWVKRNHKMIRAHRYYYEQKYGPYDHSLVLDHLCKTPACVNPDHLEPVSVAENTRRGKSAKLTYESVEEIKRLWKKGNITQTELAKIYNVYPSHISRIVRGYYWGGDHP